MRLCQQDDPSLFLFLLPFVLSKNFLPAYMINNSELVYLIVSCVDSKQLKDLVAAIISQDIVLLKEPEVVKVASKKAQSVSKRQTKNSSTTRANKSQASANNSNKKRKRNSGKCLLTIGRFVFLRQLYLDFSVNQSSLNFLLYGFMHEK